MKISYTQYNTSAVVWYITNISIGVNKQCADQRKHQSSASLALVSRIHQWPVKSQHIRPVTWKMFPFDDVIMRNNYDSQSTCGNWNFDKRYPVGWSAPYLWMAWHRTGPGHPQAQWRSNWYTWNRIYNAYLSTCGYWNLDKTMFD